MRYEVGKSWFFPTLGVTAYPGDTIELDETVAENFMHNEPGLLKPVRHTTQAHVTATRATKPKRSRK